ncbi:hypothetical protein STTU_3193 [Streptomyces sp. Tu6071]|nr:hypothetical protein STTU_3193 [Streptomyces sp. Tu6071]
MSPLTRRTRRQRRECAESGTDTRCWTVDRFRPRPLEQGS